MVLNLVVGVMPLGFVIGTSVAIERVAGAGKNVWGGVLLTVGLAVVSGGRGMRPAAHAGHAY